MILWNIFRKMLRYQNTNFKILRVSLIEMQLYISIVCRCVCEGEGVDKNTDNE